MRYVIIALAIYLAVALQWSLIDAFRIGPLVPSLSVMVAAVVLLLHGGNRALAIVALIGLLEDALWPGRLGVAMAWHLLLGWALLEIGERFDLRPLSRRVAATGVYAAVLSAVVGTTRYALGESGLDITETWALAGGIGLYTAAVAIPFWILLGRGERAGNRRLARYEF